eukprot:CAMPEP_0114159584 /NCGR_PEP_ID=MMETSP0043_2-20121206/27863_1 /TAXON_ID=464988 /ORGANISM="Hemiselmis andersenii, Strain CCMP644" /LENGTH=105 /DNA_ID=CAMNT_0001255489 /DNA_START=246 /DNA_END=559 /DNA_ORIENTATION=-
MRLTSWLIRGGLLATILVALPSQSGCKKREKKGSSSDADAILEQYQCESLRMPSPRPADLHKEAVRLAKDAASLPQALSCAVHAARLSQGSAEAWATAAHVAKAV